MVEVRMPIKEGENWKLIAVNPDGTRMYDDNGVLIDYSNKQNGYSNADGNTYGNTYNSSPQQEPEPEYKLTPEEDAQRVEEIRRWQKRKDNPIMAWISRELTKPALKGLAAIPDVPVLLNNLILAGVNKFGGTNIKGLPLPSEKVGEAVDYITDGLSESDPHTKDGIIARGVEFGTSMYGGGAIGKGLKALAPTSKAAAKTAPWLGSTKKGDVTAGVTAGMATQAAEDFGFDPATSTVIGLGAGLAPSAIFNKLAKNSVKNFNLKAYEAAERQGLDLPKVSLDQTSRSKLSTTVGEHSLYAGNKLKEQAKSTNKSFKAAFDRILDKNTTKKTIENIELNRKLYKESEGMLTDRDLIIPKNTFDSVEKAQKDIMGNALVTTTKQEQYNRYLDKLRDATMNFKTNGNFGIEGIEVRKLIEQKQQLNNQISKIPREEWALKEELINVRNAVKKDIEEFAKNNPEFKQKWSEAESLYGKMEKRVEAEKKLGLKETVNNWDLDPKAIAKNYLNIKNDVDFIRVIGKENIKHFDDIVTAVKSLPYSKVSDLSQNMKIMGAIASSASNFAFLTTGAVAGGWPGVGLGAGAKVGVEVLAHLWSRKNSKVIDKLAQYARHQTAENAKIVNNTYKKELGMSVDKVNESLEALIKDSRKAKIRLGAEEFAKSVNKKNKQNKQ